MRIFHVLDKIENAIYNSKKIPLMNNYAIVRKDKILNLIEKTRQSLPEEMKQARWVSKENQRILQEAQTKAGEIIRESEKRSNDLVAAAREESHKLLDKEQIVVNAKNRADEILEEARGQAGAIISQAEAKAREILGNADNDARFTRDGADQYALKILGGMEKELSRVLEIISKSREALVPQSQPPPSTQKTKVPDRPSTMSVPKPQKPAGEPPAKPSHSAPPVRPASPDPGGKATLTIMGPGPGASARQSENEKLQKSRASMAPGAPGITEDEKNPSSPRQGLSPKGEPGGKKTSPGDKPSLMERKNQSQDPGGRKGMTAKPGFGRD